MPTINFPTGPSTNDTYNLGTRTWRWNGEAWELQPLTGGFTGSQGYTGSIGYTGSAGAGYTGSKGDIGYTGSIGYSGSKGDQGVIGYTGSRGGSLVNGTTERFTFTVSGTPTTITGNDDNGNALSYDSGLIDVFLNGIKMVNGTDVTVTSGTSVVFASALSNGDIVDITTFGIFNITQLGTPLTFADNGSIVLGTGSDFEILHDGSSSVIKDVQGNQIYMQSTNFNLSNSSGLKHIYANDSYGVTLYYQDSAKLETTSNGVSITGVASLTNTTLSDSLLITTTEDSSTAGPVITLKRNSTSPADADYLGQIKFKGENDADQEVVYAKITAKISDASDGSEDGILEFAHKKAGSNVITGRWKSDKLMLLNGTDLDVNGDITLSTVNNTTNIQIKDSSGNVLKTMYGTTS